MPEDTGDVLRETAVLLAKQPPAIDKHMSLDESYDHANVNSFLTLTLLLAVNSPLTTLSVFSCRYKSTPNEALFENRFASSNER